LDLGYSNEIVECTRLAPCLLGLTTLSALTLSCQRIHKDDAPLLACALASCTSLKRLEFHVKDSVVRHPGRVNESAEVILSVLPALSKLTHLHLSRELACRVLPEILPKLPELRHLCLDDLNAEGFISKDADIGAALGTLRHLQHLSVANNYLSDVEMVPLLATLPTTLTYLNLDKNRLPPDFPRLSQLKRLQVLSLHCCVVRYAVAERFTALTALEKLFADNASMCPRATVALLSALPSCITHVEIMGSSFPMYAAQLLQDLKALQVLLGVLIAVIRAAVSVPLKHE
jgi:hypothetical protein